MKAALKNRKLALIERIASIQEPKLLEEVLDRLEIAFEPEKEGTLSDWALAELKAGMASTAAGHTVPVAVADKIIADAIEKAKLGPHAKAA